MGRSLSLFDLYLLVGYRVNVSKTHINQIYSFNFASTRTIQSKAQNHISATKRQLQVYFGFGQTMANLNIKSGKLYRLSIKRILYESQIISSPRLQMGNGSSDSSNPFYAQDGNKESQLSLLLQQFTFVSIYEDQLFGRCSIIQHRQSKQLIITKQIVCQGEAQMQKLYGQFERRKNTLTNMNLLRLRYIVKKKIEGMFSDEYKIILFFDYIVTSLIAQFRNRIKTQKYFTNQEINIITCGALKGYAALQQQNISNNKVRLTNIYFGLVNNMPLPKVIDSNLFPTPTNLQLARKLENVEDIFLAPEELKNMEEAKYQNSKSGIFSLAVSILQLCLLTSSKDLYNYNKRTINYAQLENRLNIVKNKYPLSIYCLLRDMLERDDDTRPSFHKLSESLPTNFKNLPTTMNISLMKTAGDNSKVINNPSNNFSKILNPLSSSRNTKRMTGTLVSEYRPQIQVSQIYTNGNRFEGQLKDNLRHGKGKYIYNDGSYYLGDWIKGKMEGQGQLFDSQSNLIYDGTWKDDHYEGNGRLMGVGTDWLKYEGQFKCGKMQGFGQMWFYDGKRYKGQFRNDLPWGRGRMFGRNGQVQNGNWEKGNFISQF